MTSSSLIGMLEVHMQLGVEASHAVERLIDSLETMHDIVIAKTAGSMAASTGHVGTTCALAASGPTLGASLNVAPFSLSLAALGHLTKAGAKFVGACKLSASDAAELCTEALHKFKESHVACCAALRRSGRLHTCGLLEGLSPESWLTSIPPASALKTGFLASCRELLQTVTASHGLDHDTDAVAKAIKKVVVEGATSTASEILGGGLSAGWSLFSAMRALRKGVKNAKAAKKMLAAVRGDEGCRARYFAALQSILTALKSEGA